METPCPSVSGNIVGYVPEYKNSDGIWKRILIKEVAGCGVPRGQFDIEILSLASVFSYESAMCISWAYRASVNPHIDVRVVPYLINYSMEAYRKEEDALQLPSGIGVPIKGEK